MMETMPELGGFRLHYEAGAKQTKWEAYSGGTLLELSLYVLQGCGMVYRDTEFGFQLHENARELMGLASNGKPSAQKIVLPGMLYERYACSSCS